MLGLAYKEKNKVIEFLKEIATSSISSVDASGILYAIGNN